MGGTFSLTAAIRAIFDPHHSLTGYERLVAACLARHADAWGESFPSVPMLARECGVSENTVRRALAGLKKKGWVTVERREGRTAVYRLAPSPQAVTPSPEVGVTSRESRVPANGEPLHHREGTPSPEVGVPATGEPEVDTHLTDPNISADSPRTSYSENQRASRPDGPEPERPPTNRDLIAELGNAYRAVVPPEKHAKGDYAFIGRLYNEFGYDAVLVGIEKLGYRIDAGDVPDRPLVFLRGIINREARASPAGDANRKRVSTLDWIPKVPFGGEE